MSDSKKIVLKNLTAHNTIWHPDSTLVFKSRKDRLVIGRYVDDELIPLDNDALHLCEVWKFKPDESLFDEDEEAEKVADEGNNQSSDEEVIVKKDEVIVKKDEVIVKKEEIIVSKEQTRTGKPSIQNITENFTAQLYNEFDLIVQEKSVLSDKFDEKVAELAELQKKYDEFKKKFDAMKSLFT